MKSIYTLMFALILLPTSQLATSSRNSSNSLPASNIAAANESGATSAREGVNPLAGASPTTAANPARETKTRAANAGQRPGAQAVPAGPRTHIVTVDTRTGAFSPANINIRAGDTVEWRGLNRRDAIVQIADPTLAPPGSDVCGIRNSNVAHAYANNDSNEFTGPMRTGVSGIFALGPDSLGYVNVAATDRCQCEPDPSLPPAQQKDKCKPAPTIVGGRKICPDQGTLYETLDATMSNPDITGIIIRLSWSDLQKDVGGRIQYVWTDLDRQMNRAVRNGKLFTLDVRAGMEGTPPWIFTTYGGPGLAPPGPVTPLVFKDWASGDTPQDNCGFKVTIGSPTHTAYLNLYMALLRNLAKHVASDSRWFQALAHVKVSGANFITSEARLPNRCPDEDGNGKLDTIAGDPCICNSQRWADASYTPEGLYHYYRFVEHEIYESFFAKKSMGYQLIQGGFPAVTSATNFDGDSLSDQDSRPLLRPAGIAGDEIKSIPQTEKILEEGRDAIFVDPLMPRSSRTVGLLFVAQHSGLQQFPEDTVGGRKCSQRQPVDPITHRANFPIGNVKADPDLDGCPNEWAVNEGTLYGPRVMGFQTTNAHSGVGPVDSPAHVESALWNLTINSNAIFLELYEERLWEISRTMGSGPSATVLTPGRDPSSKFWTGRLGNPAPYTKTLHQWVEELHDRRKILAGLNPNLPDPFPTTYRHTFSKRITSAQNYYYINPAKCTPAQGANSFGSITVTP